MLNITINEQEKGLLVTLVGDFDNVSSAQAVVSLEPIFEHTDCNVIFDCRELSYISSSGLRIMLNVYKHIHGNGHYVILKGMTNDIKDVFLLGGFLQLFITED